MNQGLLFRLLCSKLTSTLHFSFRYLYVMNNYNKIRSMKMKNIIISETIEFIEKLAIICRVRLNHKL